MQVETAADARAPQVFEERNTNICHEDQTESATGAARRRETVARRNLESQMQQMQREIEDTHLQIQELRQFKTHMLQQEKLSFSHIYIACGSVFGLVISLMVLIYYHRHDIRAMLLVKDLRRTKTYA